MENINCSICGLLKDDIFGCWGHEFDALKEGYVPPELVDWSEVNYFHTGLNRSFFLSMFSNVLVEGSKWPKEFICYDYKVSSLEDLLYGVKYRNKTIIFSPTERGHCNSDYPKWWTYIENKTLNDFIKNWVYETKWSLAIGGLWI